jgi:hypothetical protein
VGAASYAAQPVTFPWVEGRRFDDEGKKPGISRVVVELAGIEPATF